MGYIIETYEITPNSVIAKLNKQVPLQLPELYVAKKNGLNIKELSAVQYYRSAASYYNDAIKKHQDKINVLKKRLSEDKKLSQKVKSNINKQIQVQQTKIASLNRKYKDKDSKAHYKYLKNKYAKRAEKTMNNIKNETMYQQGYPYLMPNNPHTDKSYAFLFLTAESNPHSNNVSSVTPERGMSKTTTTSQNPTTVSLTGTFAPPLVSGIKFDSKKYANRLYKQVTHWADTASDMYYSGSKVYKSCIISDFTPDFPVGPDGAVNAINFSITLTLTSYFDDTATKKQGKTKRNGRKAPKNGKKTNQKGRKQFVTAKAGDTYTTIARKKGVSVSTVKSKNDYKDTSIPVGAKIYY